MNKKLYSRIIPVKENYIVRKHRLWGIMSSDDVLLPIAYDMVYWFAGGYVGMLKNGEWGLADYSGKILIEPQYKFLMYYSSLDVCLVSHGGKRFAVNVNNEKILFDEDANVKVEGQKLVKIKNGKWQLYNADGSQFSNVHEGIFHFNGTYTAFDQNKEIIIKPDGTEMVLPFSETGLFYDNIAVFRDNGKYGLTDIDAKILLPNEYAYIMIDENLIAVNVGGNKPEDESFYPKPYGGVWYILDREYKPINNFCYQDVINEHDSWYAKRNNLWYSVTSEKETLFAKNDKEYHRKAEQLAKKIEKGLQIHEDTTYKGDGRKLYVTACDGVTIRRYYYTPYLPQPDDDNVGQWIVGEYYVNDYGQHMHDPNACKYPPDRSRRIVLKCPSKLMRMKASEINSLLLQTLSNLNLKKNDCYVLMSINPNKRGLVTLLDWINRKIRQKKDITFSDLIKVSMKIESWLK